MERLSYPGHFMRRHNDEACFLNRKQRLIQLHSSFNNNLLRTNTGIIVIDSHGAYPFYDKTRDTIIMDSHFFDILKIVTAAMLDDNMECMDALADLCAADYFLCKDEIYLSLKYANSFNCKKEKIKNALKETEKEASRLLLRQQLFVLSHEQGHALLTYDKADERFSPFRYHFSTELERLNLTTQDILSIDISPIKEDLDRIDKSVFTRSYNCSDRDALLLYEFSQEILEIVKKGLGILEIPETVNLSRSDAVYYACDQYLKGSELIALERHKYENDCIIDGYTLQRLVSAEINEETTISRMRETAFAYYSCLLTMNIITCVNACVMNYGTEGYKEEDLVWNRLRLEREIYNNVMIQYAFRQTRGIQLSKDIFEYTYELIEMYNKLYASFCDRVFAVEQPNKNTPYCPCNSPKYSLLYNEVFSLCR